MEEHKVELRNSRLQGPLDSDVDELGLDRLTDTVPFPKRGVIIMAIAAAVGFALYATLPFEPNVKKRPCAACFHRDYVAYRGRAYHGNRAYGAGACGSHRTW